MFDDQKERGAASTPQEAYRYNQKYITPEGQRKGQLPTVDDCRREFNKDTSQGMPELRIRVHKAGWNMSGRAALVPLAELLIEQIIKDGQQPPGRPISTPIAGRSRGRRCRHPRSVTMVTMRRPPMVELRTLPDDVHAPGTPHARGDSDGATPPLAPATLEPDCDQLEMFVKTIFRRAALEGFVSLRTFPHERSKPASRITPINLKGGLDFLIAAAEDDARRAAQHPTPLVFCPPLATFTIKEHAREQDIAEGLVLSAELDQHPRKSLDTLQEVLGPATVVVKSGGRWSNGGAEVEDKLHGHWRLQKTASTAEDIAKLKRARELATKLVGGDATNVPLSHPIRWPGSWHRKVEAEPRMAVIETVDADREIDLDVALAALTEAAQAAGIFVSTQRTPGDEPQAGLSLVGAALGAIARGSNYTDERDQWIRVGMATHAATGASESGFAAFDRFSAKFPKYDADDARRTWDSFKPTQIGAGTLIYLADEAQPGWREEYGAKLEAELEKTNKAAINTAVLAGASENKGEVGRSKSTTEDKPNDPSKPADGPGPGDEQGRARPGVVGGDAYYGFAGEVVRAFEQHTEASPASILLQFLVAAGNLFGRHCYYLIEGTRHYPNLQLALLGTSALARKGTSWGRVRQVIAACEPDYVRDNVKPGLSSGEGLIHAVRDPSYKWDAEKQIEIEVDHGVEDKRLLIVEPEFASVLSVAERSGNTISPLLRCAWDDGNLATLTRANPLTATNAHISTIYHITVEELKARLAGVDLRNGFANQNPVRNHQARSQPALRRRGHAGGRHTGPR